MKLLNVYNFTTVTSSATKPPITQNYQVIADTQVEGHDQLLAYLKNLMPHASISVTLDSTIAVDALYFG